MRCLYALHMKIPKWLFLRRPWKKKLIYPDVIRAFSDVEKPFLSSDLAALTAISVNKKRLYNVREGSDYPAAG